MKKSHSFLCGLTFNNRENTKYESMKKVFHNPLKQIKSKILLNSFTTDKFKKLFKNPKKSEYTIILNQKKKELNNITNITNNHNFIFFNNNCNDKKKKIKKSFSYFIQDKMMDDYNIKITGSDYSSNNYNSKVGLNAPLSYKELSSKNSYIDDHDINYNININKIENEKNKIKRKSINLNKNDNEYRNINIKTIETKNNFTIKNTINTRSYSNIFKNKIKTRNNINKNNNDNNNSKNNSNNNSYIINKFFVIYDINNKNNSYYYKNQRKNKNNIRTNYSFNKSYDKNKILKTNKSNSNKSIFHFILMSLNYEKIYKNKKQKNRVNKTNKSAEIKNNSIDNNKLEKTYEPFFSSGNISLDLDTSTNKYNQINSTYNLTKNFSRNKNNYFNSVLQKSSTFNQNNITIKNNWKSTLNLNARNTKDKTNKTIEYQNDVIINMKNNFKKNKNMSRNIVHNLVSDNNNIYSGNTIKKSVDNGYIYKKFIEGNKFKKRINPNIKIYKLEDIRKKIIEDEIIAIQNKSKINDISQSIVKNYLPIYKRANNIENKKKLNTEIIEELTIKDKKIKENTIYNKYAKNISDEKNIINLSNQLKDLKKFIKNEKIKEDYYKFKSSINKNNGKIYDNKYINNNFSVISKLKNEGKESKRSRESKESYIIKNEDEELFTFRPDINKSFQIKNQFYEYMDKE